MLQPSNDNFFTDRNIEYMLSQPWTLFFHFSPFSFLSLNSFCFFPTHFVITLVPVLHDVLFIKGEEEENKLTTEEKQLAWCLNFVLPLPTVSVMFL